MIAKQTRIAIALISFFGQSFLWSDQCTIQTIYERTFSTEIADVIFSSYMDGDALSFYPKVVILNHIDPELSQGEYVYHKKEVQILNKEGDVEHNLWFPFWTRIGCSDNGNYFYAWTTVREKPQPYRPSEVYNQKIKDAYFRVYDDQGDLLWGVPFEPIYDAGYSFRVSPKDGSVIELLSTYFDSQGHAKRIKPLCGYTIFEIYGFSRNWDYVVALAYKNPEAFRSPIPAINPEPRVLLLDSLLGLVWERPLDEYNGYGAAISPGGSYIYASSNTFERQKTDIQKGYLVSSTGCLFDRQGNVVMKVEHGSYPIVFSENEQYLLAMYYTPSDTLINEVGLVDVNKKRILYKKNFRVNNAVVAANGSVAVLRRIIPEFDQELREGMSVREARKYRMRLDEQAVWKATVFDREGTTLLETDRFASMGKMIVYDILSWDGTRLLLSVQDNTQNISRILLIESVEK
jgi:hypothetical protein